MPNCRLRQLRQPGVAVRRRMRGVTCFPLCGSYRILAFPFGESGEHMRAERGFIEFIAFVKPSPCLHKILLAKFYAGKGKLSSAKNETPPRKRKRFPSILFSNQYFLIFTDLITIAFLGTFAVTVEEVSNGSPAFAVSFFSSVNPSLPYASEE